MIDVLDRPIATEAASGSHAAAGRPVSRFRSLFVDRLPSPTRHDARRIGVRVQRSRRGVKLAGHR